MFENYQGESLLLSERNTHHEDIKQTNRTNLHDENNFVIQFIPIKKFLIVYEKK